jgi:GNAT superfamily N-acetyltransferase
VEDRDQPLRFDADYRETVSLADGTAVVLRLLRPEDKVLLTEGFEHLSERSRWRRFLSPKVALSTAELRYLTEIDGVNHFALGAVMQPPGKPELGLGVARFVRLPGKGAVAEPAVVVIDQFQGRGLGKILLQRLVEAARERGIESFRAIVLGENMPVQALLRQYVPGAVPYVSEDGLTIEMPLPELSDLRSEGQPVPLGVFDRLLALAAGGLLLVLTSLQPWSVLKDVLGRIRAELPEWILGSERPKRDR